MRNMESILDAPIHRCAPVTSPCPPPIAGGGLQNANKLGKTQTKPNRILRYFRSFAVGPARVARCCGHSVPNQRFLYYEPHQLSDQITTVRRPFRPPFILYRKR